MRTLRAVITAATCCFALVFAAVTTASAQVPTSRSEGQPIDHVVFALDSQSLSGLSVRWRGSPTQAGEDTDAGAQFNLCGMLPGAELQALTVRIGQARPVRSIPGRPACR